MLSFDIDRFKQVNDTHGHDAGDVVLRTLSETIRRQIRSADIFARVGGEEFVLLLPDVRAPTALAVAERIRQAVENTDIALPGGTLRVTISVGVTSRPEGGCALERVMKEADLALYEAKRTGRNRSVTFHAGMEARA